MIAKPDKSISLKRLESKVALITGSSSGIGAAIAKAYGAEGAKVVINHFGEKESAESVVKTIISQCGNAITVKADVTNSNDVAKMMDRIHDAFGPVNILVNNAGIYPRDGWEALTEEKWDRVIDVNMKGCYLCAKAVYKDMQEAGYGKIIITRSAARLI